MRKRLGVHDLSSYLDSAAYESDRAMWQAAFEAGRGGWISMESAPRDGTMILVDFGRIGVHAVSWTEAQHGAKGWCVDDLKFGPYALRRYIETDVKGWMPLPLPAPPDSGDKKGTGDGR